MPFACLRYIHKVANRNGAPEAESGMSVERNKKGGRHLRQALALLLPTNLVWLVGMHSKGLQMQLHVRRAGRHRNCSCAAVRSQFLLSQIRISDLARIATYMDASHGCSFPPLQQSCRGSPFCVRSSLFQCLTSSSRHPPARIIHSFCFFPPSPGFSNSISRLRTRIRSLLPIRSGLLVKRVLSTSAQVILIHIQEVSSEYLHASDNLMAFALATRPKLAHQNRARRAPTPSRIDCLVATRSNLEIFT